MRTAACPGTRCPTPTHRHPRFRPRDCTASADGSRGCGSQGSRSARAGVETQHVRRKATCRRRSRRDAKPVSTSLESVSVGKGSGVRPGGNTLLPPTTRRISKGSPHAHQRPFTGSRAAAAAYACAITQCESPQLGARRQRQRRNCSGRRPQLPGAIDPNRILADLGTTVDFTDDASAKAWMVDELGLTGLADKQVRASASLRCSASGVRAAGSGSCCSTSPQWAPTARSATPPQVVRHLRPDGADRLRGPRRRHGQTKCSRRARLMNTSRRPRHCSTGGARRRAGTPTCRWTPVVLRHVLDPTGSSTRMFFMVQGDARTVIAVDTITSEVTAMNPDDQ